MNQPRELDTTLVEALRPLLGERVTPSRGVREHHGKDESYYPYALPDAVVFPHSTEEVRDVVNICRLHAPPIIPFGAGTPGPAGGRAASRQSSTKSTPATPA